MKLRDKVSFNQFNGDILIAKELQNEASFYILIDKDNPHIYKFRTRLLEIYAHDVYKYKRFLEAFFGEIHPGIEICETIYSQLSRVWDSQDISREYRFSNSDLNTEAIKYIEQFDNWWMEDYWEAFKYRFCSFIVVDLPPTQITSRPEPYPFILDISDVLYILPCEKNKVKEIIFRRFEKIDDQELEYWYYYTDAFYSKYLIDGDNEIPIIFAPHKLGRCPVHKVWNEKFGKKWLISKTAITPIYEDLFWYIFKSIESKKADLLYLNPDKQMPRISCGFDSEKSHYQNEIITQPCKCVGGYLFTPDGLNPILINGIKQLCPNCGRIRHASGGAGNLIEIDLDSPVIKEGKISPSDNLVKYISPEVEGVRIQYNKVEALKEYMIKTCVGSDEQPTKSAVNELQQKAIFESKETVLKRISYGISNVRTAVDRDIFQLRYPDYYISNRHNQGTKFYLYTVDDLLKIRENAKDPIQKKQIDEQIIDVKYRHNRTKFNEERLLYKLMPYSSLTDSEFISIIERVDPIDAKLRLQFTDAIELLESEYGSIIDFYNRFSENIPEIRRIEIIRNFLISKINSYVQNQISS